jgi:hypothetical protein
MEELTLEDEFDLETQREIDAIIKEYELHEKKEMERLHQLNYSND